MRDGADCSVETVLCYLVGMCDVCLGVFVHANIIFTPSPPGFLGDRGTARDDIYQGILS